MELPTITEPDMPGAFKGDVWFGHSEQRNLGTHRWDGDKWEVLPSEIETLLILLARARARVEIAEAKAVAAETALTNAANLHARDPGSATLAYILKPFRTA